MMQSQDEKNEVDPTRTKANELPRRHDPEEGRGNGGVAGSTERFDLRHELGQLLNISIPSILVQCSMFFIFPQGASTVGRNLGTNELAGFSLGSLVGNLTCVSVIIGVLTAADTLMPRAYGSGRYEEIGRLAVRGVAVCLALLIPPVVAVCLFLDGILTRLGQDPAASALAASWVRVYVLGFPANLVFRVSQRFLVSQHVPWPPVYASVVSCLVVCPVLLAVLVPQLGFLGSAWSMALTQWSMLLYLLLYLRFKPVYDPRSWPGLDAEFVAGALRAQPLLRFLSLGLGGVVSLSEWWFWEVMGIVAGLFGVAQLCAHTIAYNLIPLLFMVPLGFSIGLSVRMGTVIVRDTGRARALAFWTVSLVAILGAILAVSLHAFQAPIMRAFTSDEDVIRYCQSIWNLVSIYVFVLYIFGANLGVLRALGMQWAMARIIFLTLWCMLLPSIMWLAVRNKGGLHMQWTLLPIFYTAMNVFLVVSYATTDWEKRSGKIQESSRPSTNDIQAALGPTEKTGLLSSRPA